MVLDEARGLRRLPSLYVNDVQLYADRDVSRVVAALEHAVEAFVHSAERATYMLTACEVGGRTGLYGTDFFNRSTYRRELRRLGMRFSDDAFVVLREDGRFESRDADAFEAEFVTLGIPSGDSIEHVRGGALLHQLVFYRIADVAPDELRRLAAIATGVAGLSATDPSALVEEITS